jgi:hypothetical protein
MKIISAGYKKIKDTYDLVITRMMDGIIEKLTLSDRDIAIAEGKVIEFRKRRTRRR